MKIICFLIILMITACGDSTSSNIDSGASDTASSISNSSSVGSTSDTKVIKDSNVVIKDDKSDTLITVTFPKDSTWTKIEGKMRGVKYPVTVVIPVKQGKQLSASLQTEEPTANIRINQIFTPDNKADGPFGKELKYPIKMEGNYQLKIGENMMQGDEWKGTFWLTISVK